LERCGWHSLEQSAVAARPRSRGLAKRVAGSGVTVNAVLPGPTLSEGIEAMLEDSEHKAGLSIEEAAIAFVKAQRPSSIIQRQQRSMRSRTWWSTSPRPRHLPPRARRFGSTAAWSTPSRERARTGRPWSNGQPHRP